MFVFIIIVDFKKIDIIVKMCFKGQFYYIFYKEQFILDVLCIHLITESKFNKIFIVLICIQPIKLLYIYIDIDLMYVKWNINIFKLVELQFLVGLLQPVENVKTGKVGLYVLHN